MKRLCVVDMNFTWPPTWSPVNLYNMLSHFAKQYETILLIPKLARVSRIVQKLGLSNRTKFSSREVTFSQEPPSGSRSWNSSSEI